MAYLVGETVQLKSGGPIMTVVKVDDVNRITCMWYAESQGELRTQVFSEALLDTIEMDEDDD